MSNNFLLDFIIAFMYLEFICCEKGGRRSFEVMGYVYIGNTEDKQCQESPKKIELLTTNTRFQLT